MSTAQRYYTKAFDLTGYEDLSLLVCVNDTTVAGFKSDSCHFVIGLRLGCYVKNYAGTVQEFYDNDFWDLDTFNVDSAGVTKTNKLYFDGTSTYYGTGIDTAQVSGYMVKHIKGYLPPWATLMKVYVYPLSKNKKASPLRLKIQINRRLGTMVLTKKG
jgi:hypothetical protein